MCNKILIYSILLCLSGLEASYEVVLKEDRRIKIEPSIARVLGLDRPSVGWRGTQVEYLEHTGIEEFMMLLQFIRSFDLSRSSKEYKTIIRNCMAIPPAHFITLLRRIDLDARIKNELLKLIGKTCTQLSISKGLVVLLVCQLIGIVLSVPDRETRDKWESFAMNADISAQKSYNFFIFSETIQLIFFSALVGYIYQTFAGYKNSNQCTIGKTVGSFCFLPIATITWSPKMLQSLKTELDLSPSRVEYSDDDSSNQSFTDVASQALIHPIIDNHDLKNSIIYGSQSNREAYKQLEALTSYEFIRALKIQLIKFDHRS